MSAIMLVHPHPACPIGLTTDASETHIGGVLEQHQDGLWKPLGFWSKHLPPEKQKWTTYRRELYAVLQAVRHFKDDFEGRDLTVYTDH